MGVKERYEQRMKSGSKSSHSGVKDRYILKEIGNIVDTWAQDHNTYVLDYQKRYAGRKYTYEDAYVGDSAYWLDEAKQRKDALDTRGDTILSYLNQYKDQLDADWISKVSSAIADTRSTRGVLLDNANKDNKYWARFAPNEEQKAAGYTAEKLYNEWQTGQKQYAEDQAYDVEAGLLELEGLKKERDAYLAEQEEKRKQAKEDESFWDKLGRWMGTTPDTTIPLAGANDPISSEKHTNKYDKRIAELEERIERAKYVQGYEGYMDNIEAVDYVTNSQYASTRTDVAKEDARVGIYKNQYDESMLFGDFLYDYINRNEDAISVAMLNNATSGAYFLGFDKGFLQTMTDDEIGVYNYLYKTQGKESANEYLNYIQNDLEGRKRAQEQAYWSNYAKESPVASSVFSTLISPLKGVSYLSQAADMLDDGKMEENAGYNRFSYIPSTIRSQVSTTIENSGKWGKVGSFAYNTGMSMADFLFTTAVSGGNQALSLSIMGTGAAADATLAAKDRGLDDGQAFALGTIAGLAEVAMEKISLSAWLEGDMTEGALRYVLKNALSEGGEEAGTSMINLLADVMIAGDKSEWNMAMQAYIDQGKSPQEAFGLVAAEQAAQIGLDALGGILSGAAIGGGTYAGTSIGASFQYRDTAKNKESAQKLVTEGLELNPKSQYIQKAKTKLDKGKNLTGMQVRNILAANKEQITANDMKKIQKAAEQRFTSLGETGDVSKLAELATKWATGQDLNPIEKRTLTHSDYGSRVANELLPSNIMSGDYSTGWAEEIGTKQVNAVAYNKKQITSILEQMASAEDPNAYKSLESRVDTETPAKVSDTGKAVIRATGEEIDLTTPTFKQITEDGVILEADGKTVRSNEIDYDSEDQGLAISAIGKIEHITPAVATSLYAKLDMTKSVMKQLNGMDEAFTYGYYNYSEADLEAGDFTGDLTKDQLKDAYNLGRYVRKNSEDAKTDAHKAMRTAAQAEAEKTAAQGKKTSKSKKMTITYNEGNGKIVDFDKAGVKLSAKQEGGVAVAKILHKLGLGTNFEFFTSKMSKDEDGNPVRVFVNDAGVEEVAYSGVYRTGDGTIRIDLNAYNGRGLTLNALAHELTHFVQQWSGAKYKVLADFLIKTYEKTDMTMHQRVLREQARLKRTRGKKVSYSKAYDEVVANAMSKMLDDGKLVERLAELKATDEKLARKLWEGFKKTLAKFIGIYEKESALFHDAADLMAMKDTFEQLQNMFAEALVEASENYQTAITAAVGQTIAATEQHSSQETDIDTDADSAYDSAKKETEQEDKANVRREEVSHRVNAESSRRVGKENSGGEGSARESCERRIKEVLRQKAAKRHKESAPGRGRVETKETREDFESRVRNDGLMYVEAGSVAIAFQVAPEANWNENAKAAAVKLRAYGFDVVVFTGEMHHNKKDVTGTSADGSTMRLAGKLTIFISSELDIDGMETAYHEAFHAAGYGMFAKYHEAIANMIASNVDIESDAFAQFVSEIADLYAYRVSDVSANKFAAEIIEEFYAWYVGKAYATQSGDMRVYMSQFSDMEAIKQQIDGVYARMEANAGKALPGLLEGDMYSSQETDLDSNAHPYAYNTLISKPDMVVTTVDGNVPKNRADVVYQAKQNAAKVGKFDPKTGSVSVYVDDINANVLLGTDGLKHGLRRTKDPQSDANYIVTIKAGEIIKNSIKVNEMNPTKVDAKESLVLIGVAKNPSGDTYVVRSIVNRFSNELTSIDVLYAINAKKQELAATKSPRFTAEPLSETSSTISIAELLDLVNQYFPDVLPEDVLKHYGYDARPEGDLGKSALYSGHETDNVSNRDLLAIAFEGITKSSPEYKLIQEYKGRIRIINEYEEDLAKINAEIRKLTFGTEGQRDTQRLKQLQAEANKLAESINRNDKKLLSLEASEPLRKVIERERKKEAQKTKEHVKEIQQNKKVRAEQTELRHKIRKVVRDLDKLLNRGNKKQNVKEDMKGFASKALELADYLFTDHISNDELIRKGITVRMTPREAALVKETEDILSKLYDHADSLTDEEFTQLDAKRKANEDKLRDLLTAQRNERLSTPVYNLFNDLVTEYASLKNSKQDAVKAAYNEVLEESLRSFMSDDDRVKILKNMRVADMTTEELNWLYRAYTMVLTNVRSANKFFAKGMTESIDAMVTQIVTDFGSRKIPDKKLAIVAQKIANKIGWDYEKLYYALDRVGSEAFTKLIMNIANSENIVMQDVMEATAFRNEMVEKYGFNNWAVNKEIDREFLDNTGKKFKLTLGQLMALYAYSRREGAWDHIEYGGFVFGEAALTNPKPADSYKLTKEQCEEITSLLTNEQKGYAEEMQKFLSKTMGAKGNEVSMQLYGIEMFGEENYFPIHVSGDYKAQANESQAKAAEGFQSMSNAGFTHAQNRNAKAPFVLEGFNEIWVDHVNEMSRYHGTVPALEDLRRVMNRSSYSDSTAESTSVKVIMKNHFGEEAVDYFNSLYREANSGAITDKLQRKQKKLLSLFRKNSVAYSLSVVIQQPSAIARAYAMIDKKYFGFKGVGVLTSGVAKAVSSKWNPAYANAYNEMLKYAPGVTMAKEIGGFDTHTGTSIREYLLDTGKSFKQSMKTESLKGKAKAALALVDDNAIANLPAVADKIAWIEIWNACKRETVAKHKDLATNSKEFMQLVGERFTEVIRATQVYDSMFSKSPLLKSKSLAVQYLVSFMNEPNTTINMAEKAIRDATKGDWKGGVRIAAAVTYSIIFNNVLKAIVYAMRDDDEDETYIEKYIEAVVGGVVADFNPLSYIPYARDVVSKLQGFDVERPDVAIVADAIEAYQAIVKNANKDTEGMTEYQLAELEKKVADANWKLVGSLAAFFGIPVKNIYREVKGVIDHARIASANAGMTTPSSLWDKVIASIPFVESEATKTGKLYDAILSGDKDYIERMKNGYVDKNGNYDKAKYESAVVKALRENDSRIHDAAQAGVDGNSEERNRIFNEIKAELGAEYANLIIDAINAEASKIRNDAEPDKVTGQYEAYDFVAAVSAGDANTAKSVREDIISTYIANGKTQAEAEKAFVSDVKSGIDEAYSYGMINKATAKEMLMEYADMEEEDASDKITYWDFRKKNPNCDLSESKVLGYLEFAEPAHVSLDMYEQFVSETKDLADIKDEWGDVEVTKREQVLEVIDSLPLTWEQKDALYLAAGYAEDKIWDVPW